MMVAGLLFSSHSRPQALLPACILLILKVSRCSCVSWCSYDPRGTPLIDKKTNSSFLFAQLYNQERNFATKRKGRTALQNRKVPFVAVRFCSLSIQAFDTRGW